MNEEMIERICAEKHKRVDEQLEVHETRLNSHSKEIDRLSTSDTKNSTQIEHLCGKIDDLVVTIKWFIGLIAGSLVGFFFYVLQTKVLS